MHITRRFSGSQDAVGFSGLTGASEVRGWSWATVTTGFRIYEHPRPHWVCVAFDFLHLEPVLSEWIKKKKKTWNVFYNALRYIKVLHLIYSDWPQRRRVGQEKKKKIHPKHTGRHTTDKRRIKWSSWGGWGGVGDANSKQVRVSAGGKQENSLNELIFSSQCSISSARDCCHVEFTASFLPRVLRTVHRLPPPLLEGD